MRKKDGGREEKRERNVIWREVEGKEEKERLGGSVPFDHVAIAHALQMTTLQLTTRCK